MMWPDQLQTGDGLRMKAAVRIDRRKVFAGLAGTVTIPWLGRQTSAEEVYPAADQMPGSERYAVSPTRLAADPLRPQFHLLPAANWMNDPNAPIYWNGNYHMFYQYNPDGAYWGNMHWGHAVSPDMVHWRHRPVALAPTQNGPDSEGCFSGTAAVVDGRVTVFYTGVRSVSLDEATIQDNPPNFRETQCVAITEDDSLDRWTKLPIPVIDTPPAHVHVNGFRDPSPWRQGEWWYTVVGSGVASAGGAVLLYRSRDFKNWEYRGILAERAHASGAPLDPFNPWEVWECPEFFALGDRHVLIFSEGGPGRCYWRTGKLDAESMRFQTEQSGILDYGSSFYAAKTQLDAEGNRVLWGWVPETRPLEAYKSAGWAGMISLPRVLSLAPDGSLRCRVADQVTSLRGRESRVEVGAGRVEIERQLQALELPHCCGEILLRVHLGAEALKIVLHGAGEKQDWLEVAYDPQSPTELRVQGKPLSLRLDENRVVELRFFVDGSVIEAMLNEQQAWTCRFYPPDGASDLRIRYSGSTSAIREAVAWPYAPISGDRLTR